uniref:Uncharacterized protein n=1 Tax=Opuntia streptacantha TaxID=393608 RepID=A0A7C9DVK6_OPUST
MVEMRMRIVFDTHAGETRVLVTSTSPLLVSSLFLHLSFPAFSLSFSDNDDSVSERCSWLSPGQQTLRYDYLAIHQHLESFLFFFSTTTTKHTLLYKVKRCT